MPEMATMAEIKALSYREDADVLERAARIIRRRLKKPGGIALAVFCRVLTDQAAKLRDEAAEALGGGPVE